MAAIWVGLWFAGQFVAPIRRLISAAQQVTRGNLKVELPIRRGEGDLRRLSMNFNAMTKELERQRTDLLTANTQLIERRRFMEAVLSGVSAGVIGLDEQDRITSPTGVRRSSWGHHTKLSSAVHWAMRFAICSGAGTTPREHRSRPQHQLKLTIVGEERNFSVRVTREAHGNEDHTDSSSRSTTSLSLFPRNAPPLGGMLRVVSPTR